jgi:hypothetical protein
MIAFRVEGTARWMHDSVTVGTVMSGEIRITL